jgi:hypothetical protein
MSGLSVISRAESVNGLAKHLSRKPKVAGKPRGTRAG